MEEDEVKLRMGKEAKMYIHRNIRFDNGVGIPFPTISYRVAEFIESVKDERIEDILMKSIIESAYIGEEEDQFITESFEEFFIAKKYGYKTIDGEVVHQKER